MSGVNQRTTSIFIFSGSYLECLSHLYIEDELLIHPYSFEAAISNKPNLSKDFEFLRISPLIY